MVVDYTRIETWFNYPQTVTHPRSNHLTATMQFFKPTTLQMQVQHPNHHTANCGAACIHTVTYQTKDLTCAAVCDWACSNSSNLMDFTATTWNSDICVTLLHSVLTLIRASMTSAFVSRERLAN